MKKVLPILALLAGAAAPLSAQPIATLDQLNARQVKERRELLTDQKRRSEQLKKTTAGDQELFKHRQKEKALAFEAELKAEKAVFAASLQGLPKDERKRKKAEFKAQCKQKQAEFKRSAAQDRERSSHDVQAKWDFLREVQANETRQLAEKQRSELEHFQP